MTISIDAATGAIIGDTGHKYTWDSLQNMHLRCPRCGTPVGLSQVAAGSLASVGEPLYYVGRPTYRCQCYSPEVV